MMKRWLAAVSIVLALVTLPAWATQPRGQDVDRASGDLQFEYQFGIDDGERLVGIPADLASGDRFVVRLRASQPAYACLFVTDTSGSYSLMRSESPIARKPDGPGADQPCARVGKAWAVLPDAEATMRLDDREGVERLYLIVSRQPIAEVEDMPADDRVTESWLVALRDRHGKGARWTHELKPQSVNVMYRGSRGGALVAVEQLTFNHR